MKIKHGFTLVELLVVITILAILGMIALSVFSNAQKQARDAKRKSDIDAIAKSLEASRDFSVAAGTYSNKLADDFTTIPTDPNSSATSPKYCVSTSTTAFSEIAKPTVSEWLTTALCPTAATTWSQISSLVPASGVKSWKVCARLEAKDEVYCKGSMAR